MLEFVLGNPIVEGTFIRGFEGIEIKGLGVELRNTGIGFKRLGVVEVAFGGFVAECGFGGLGTGFICLKSRELGWELEEEFCVGRGEEEGGPPAVRRTVRGGGEGPPDVRRKEETWFNIWAIPSFP